jgi:peroxiredoxin
LRRWAELAPTLAAAGIRVVTVSTDTSGEISAARGAHGLDATMLADPRLQVIDAFGLRNRNINNFRIPGRPGLPVPTSLLVDPQGKVVWMDQSEHYTQRSDPDHVGAAIAAHVTG